MYDFINTHIIIKNVYSDIDKIQCKELNNFVIKEVDSDNLELLKTKLKSDFITTLIYKSIIDYNSIHSYDIIINEDIIHLNIISKNRSIKKSELNDIIAVIRFFRELDIEFPKITLKITIWMSDLKKMLPLGDPGILTSENVNTGFTIYKKSDIVKSVHDVKEIYIFRKEELHKVLIHEMIHAYDLDTYFIRNHQKYSDRLEDTYNIHSKYGIKIYESYVETIAILLHCMYLSKKDKIKFDIHKALLLETKYSLFQTAKILEYYNIHSIKEIKNNIYEESSIFSYYIIKSALLFNLKTFLKMCHTHNNNYIQIKQNWIKEFTKLIQKSLDKKNFINSIDKTLTFIIDNNKNIKNNNNIKNIKNKKYILKNLKMSLL